MLGLIKGICRLSDDQIWVPYHNMGPELEGLMWNIGFQLTKDTPYLALTAELWWVSIVNIWENIDYVMIPYDIVYSGDPL